MATDFGFIPTTEKGHYFISYNTEDSQRVAPVARKLNSMGIPVWYDYGLEYGKEWERQIARYIHDAKAVILFITNSTHNKMKSRSQNTVSKKRSVFGICTLISCMLFGVLSWYFAIRDMGYSIFICMVLSTVGVISGIASMIAGRSKKAGVAGILIGLSAVGLAFLLDHIYWNCL